MKVTIQAIIVPAPPGALQLEFPDGVEIVPGSAFPVPMRSSPLDPNPGLGIMQTFFVLSNDESAPHLDA